MSYAPSDLLDVISLGLSEIASARHVSDGVRVVTHCMYPSNGLVEVTVRGGARTIVASDDGGAVGEAMSAGVQFKPADRQMAHLVRDQGLHLKDGVIYSPQMPIEAAPLAVLLVANAARDVAQWLYEHAKIKRTRDFRALVAEFLQRTFDDRVAHNAVIVGASNKPHKFANVVSFEDGRRLIVDPVTNEPSAINARVVANLDVKAAGDSRVQQRIIYDDEESWTPADLNVLQIGAIVVPYSRSQEVITRLAAHG